LNGKFTLGLEHDFVVGYSVSSYEKNRPKNSSQNYSYNYAIPDYRTYNGDASALNYTSSGNYDLREVDQKGFYASTRLSVTGKLSLLLGARLTSYDQKNTFNTASTSTTTSEMSASSELTPYVGLMYDLTNDLSVFASRTEVFKPQSARNADGSYLEPMEGLNQEIGIKAELFNNKVNFELVYFDVKQDNAATGVFDVSGNRVRTNGINVSKGVTGTKSSGIELTWSGTVSEKLSYKLGYSHTNAKFHSDYRIWTNLPENQAHMSAKYNFSNGLSLGGDINWHSQTVGLETHPTQGQVSFEQGAYTLAEIHIGYHITDSLSTSFNVRNLLDEKYWTNIDYANYGEPRNVTLSLRYEI
jgi:outer membrane receptor for ferric coprogen and ferric-rhodotorulic acid